MKNKKLEAVAETYKSRATQNISQRNFSWRDYVGACKDYLEAMRMYRDSGRLREATECGLLALKCQEFVNTRLVY